MSIKSPDKVILEEYVTNVGEVAVIKANVPIGEILPLIAPLMAVSTVLITGFSL